jgi:alanine dehydrogenase
MRRFMEIRILSSEEVRQALPMSIAIEAMKTAFAQLSAGEATVPLRSQISVQDQGGTALFMPAWLHQSNEMALKIVSVFPKNISQGLPTIHAIVIALDAATGRPLAMLEGASLTAIRTGAASGAATDLLANPDASTVGLFGSGVQARTQLEAVCTVRDIEQVWVYSLDEDGAKAFAEEMSGFGPIPSQLKIVDDPQRAMRDADIICTATTSPTPVFDGSDLKPGAHINAVGSFTPDMQEIDCDTILKATVVVDSREAALAEAGDLIIPIKEGLIGTDWIHAELGQIINGEMPGRTDPEQVTLFKSVGVAVQDAVAAYRALEAAAQMKIGQRFTI